MGLDTIMDLEPSSFDQVDPCLCLHGHRRICAGATPTPATPTFSQLNGANAPASAATATTCGDNDPRHGPPKREHRQHLWSEHYSHN